MMKYPVLLAAFVLISTPLHARLFTATPADYTGFLSTLVAGDTLALAPGTYTQDLALRDLNGTEADPIVIMGSPVLYTTVFAARSCCNTVGITRCSYLVIRNIELNGGGVFVDAVKGEGTAGNWAHHITLEYLNIVGYNADQQSVGISTKCHAWNWTIRKNRIIGAGTGMYLGNSDGGRPFVNGVIEGNLVMNTIGYNIEIKHQADGVRDEMAGTAIDGKTIIRHNVFSKEANASTGGAARPNVLLGAFPSTGYGANDVYEVYGNFFYQNPVEALLQATGNIALYANVFVNHFDPAGFRAVYVTSQNGFSPRSVWVFHNTVWSANTSGGMRLYNPDPAYRQYCHVNAVFAPNPISNFSDAAENSTGAYADAAQQLLNASTDLAALDLYPRAGQLNGSLTSDALFSGFTDADRDFNGAPYDWHYRGAYAGCCANPGWKLQLDTMAFGAQSTSGVTVNAPAEIRMEIFPHPVTTLASLRFSIPQGGPVRLGLFDVLGRRLQTVFEGDESPGAHTLPLDIRGLRPGVYYLCLIADGVAIVHRMMISAL